MLASLLDILMPPLCPLCNSEERAPDLCGTCLADIKIITPPACGVCGTPSISKEGVDYLCGECTAIKRPFVKARSAVYYSGSAIRAIRLFKYHGHFPLIPFLARLCKDMIGSEEGLSDFIVVPVPLHKKRLKERCYNQSLLIANEVAKMLSLKIDPAALIRTRLTTPQVELKGKERRENLRGAFEVTDPAAVKNKKILLVDDVYTTGSTITECSKVLKKAGAETHVLTLARIATM
ncbi:MAG: ComF family protein [Thermodesulfobacteriota bacterium]